MIKNLIIGILAAVLVVLGIYSYKVKTQVQVAQQEKTEVYLVDSTKLSKVQSDFDNALVMLDQLNSVTKDQKEEINSLKTKIRSILRKGKVSEAEKNKALELIHELTDKINSYATENEKLKIDNLQLAYDKESLTQDKAKLSTDLENTTNAKVDLEKKVDIASTLNASNINITPLHQKSNGSEKVSNKAGRVDKLLITFDVDNRIAETGTTDVYLTLTDPKGKTVNLTDKLTTRQDGEKEYTSKISVDIITGQKSPVQISCQDTKFEKGNYKIEIYHNGFKIGEATRQLKGGIFG